MKIFISAMTFSIAWTFAVPQERIPARSERWVARVSYEDTFVRNGREAKEARICFALRDDGIYRIARLNEFAGWKQSRGSLSVEDSATFRSMLRDIHFRHSGGIVRRGAERFVLEVSDGAQPQRFEWLNPDDKAPIPPSAAKILAWIEELPRQASSSFNWENLNDDPICPSGTMLPLEPATRLF